MQGRDTLGAFVKVLTQPESDLYLNWGIEIFFFFKTKYLLKFKNTGTLICKPCYFLLSETLVITFVFTLNIPLVRELGAYSYLKYGMCEIKCVKYTRLLYSNGNT